tara:strand:+ start:340 stop:1974 length:1635 start_codon:yes stop_codon:yes gene_type:complete
MKNLLLLFILISTTALFSQNITVLDSAKIQQLNPDEIEYINISVEDELVIEKKSTILVDMSLLDIPSSFDSMQVSLVKENFKKSFTMLEAKPFLLENIDSSVTVSIVMFNNGETLNFKSINKNQASFKVDRRDRPTFVSDTIVFGILAIVLALIFYTSSLKSARWKRFYIFVPALLLCYLIPAILDSLGLISKEYSSLYTMAKNYLLPGALILMTIGIDFKGIINLGPKAIIMFLTATVGIIIGGPLAIMIYSYIDPSVVSGIGDQAAWRGFATLAGSWIGGGANQAAMLETYGYNQEFYGKMVTVDIVVANLWMAFLLWGAARAEKFDKWLKADTSSIEKLKVKMSEYQDSIAKVPTLTDYLILAGITFGLVAFSHYAGKAMAGLMENWLGSESPFSSSFFWLVVLATTGGLILSATKLRKYEGVGASKIGSVFIYILVATIGMKMELEKAVEEPQLILVGIIWMLIHVTILFIVAKIIKAPFFFVAVGSKANIGGAASAPIVAAAFHPSLASVGAILAVLGYALGTYGAILCAEMMAYVAPV